MLGKIMKKITLVAGFSILLMIVAMAAPALGQYDWDVGVSVGDWFDYESTITMHTGEFPTFLAPYYDEYLTSNYTRITITAVDFPTISYERQTYWNNGTVTVASVDEDITSDQNSIMFIGANLTEGEKIRDPYTDYFQTDRPERDLNASIMYDVYDEGARETNTLNYTYILMSNPYDYTYYWDAESGVQVYYEEYGNVPESTYSSAYEYSAIRHLTDTSTTALQVPDLTGPILLLTIMSITVPVALLHRRRKRVI
jgi:hypothetical protein